MEYENARNVPLLRKAGGIMDKEYDVKDLIVLITAILACPLSILIIQDKGLGWLKGEENLDS